jgi:hypothetical protein
LQLRACLIGRLARVEKVSQCKLLLEHLKPETRRLPVPPAVARDIRSCPWSALTRLSSSRSYRATAFSPTAQAAGFSMGSSLKPAGGITTRLEARPRPVASTNNGSRSSC